MAALDALTLSVIQSSLQQVCDEMDLTFSRAAFSPVIAEANDRSDGIYSAVDGALIAQGSQGLPVFVGVMQYSTRTLIEMIAAGSCLPPEPGDIYIVNDPYLGGTHLMDVRFAMPVYRGRRDLLLAVEHRSLARHRRRRTGRLLRLGHRGRAGGPAPAAGEAVQEGRARSRDLRHHHLQHPRRRPAHRRHPRPGGGADGGPGPAVRHPRPLRRRHRHRGDRRAPGPRRRADARPYRRHPRWYLSLAGLRRFRRRRRRAADHRALRREGRRDADLRLRRVEPALHRPDEQRHRHHAVVGLSRHAPHLPRRADQRRRLRAAGGETAGRNLPRRQVPAPRFGLRRGSLAAHRRGRLRRHGAGPARPGDGGAGRFQRQFRPRRPRPGARPRLRHVPDLRRRLRRQRGWATGSPTAARPSASRNRHRSRSWSRPSRCSTATTRCAKAPAAPASGAAVSASPTRSNCCAAKRAPPSSWTTAASARRVRSAAATAPSTTVTVFRGGVAHTPPHLSKEQDIPLKAGDRVRVGTPGGGGYGDPRRRDRALVRRDVELGYYSADEAERLFGPF